MAKNVAPTVSNLTCSNPRDGAEEHQVPVPPPFGAKRSSADRLYQWVELIRWEEPQDLGTRDIIIPREWTLDQKYHASYWGFVEQILLAKARYVEAKLEPPWPYVLHGDDMWLGIGFF